ncbi:MAG TPA: glutamate--tRNA ligase [Thermoanaerobaculia bacterium]|jgi:glutamyl-tRNA synthetase|nr:glutamate--tRNA ligase [Thermoanaerobaculia bacterium]
MSREIAGLVRVRFAPSPTGFLHVGGARTAIYNDLLRQHVGGAFILRIEDTDRERSDAAMTRQIQSALAWIGVQWDEGPYLQSERLPLHRERAQELLDRGAAYRCFCTAEELDAQRAEAQAQGLAFRYPRTCLNRSPEEVAALLAQGKPFAVRFRMPDENIRFHDLVRGDMDFPPDALDDFILLRSDGSPTYHMSVCVDDIDMRVTHVIRGEDHLSNTPKHIPLFRALGGEVPTFAHLPLILGPDKKRLSKRTGATSVEEFRAEGVLPQALYNFMALLGWTPGDDREILSRREMAEIFSVERLNASAAVFDREKLLWMNAQYLSRLTVAEILPHLQPFLEPLGLADADPARLAAAIELQRSRAHTLKELAQALLPYFQERLDYDPALAAKFLKDPALPGHLEALAGRFAALPAFDKGSLEAALRALAEERGLKAGVLIHPARLALSGLAGGPPLFDLVEVMGREAAARHLGNFVAFLREAPVAAPAAEA